MRPSPPIVTLAEWGEAVVPGARLADPDRALAVQLRRDGRVLIDEVRDGVRIATRSWVGVVSLNAVEIRIEPKLTGDRLDLLGLIQFARGLDALHRTRGEARMSAPDENLLDLLARLLVEECVRLLRGGLMMDYTAREEELPVVRGRIDSAGLVLRRFGRADRVPCRFDERLEDVVENQLLLAALRACARRVTHPTVRRHVAGLLPSFDEACDASALDLSSGPPSVEYHRLNEHYRAAHQLARLILEGSSLRALDAAGPVRTHAFLLDMNDLFQRFVWRVCERLARDTGARVRYQASFSSILRTMPDDAWYGRVVPDLVVDRGGAVPDTLPIDAKYKDYDGGKLSPADTYQAFLYAYALSTRTTPTALVVYPSSAGELSRARVRVRAMNCLPPGEIHVVGVPVREVLSAFRGGTSRAHAALRADLAVALS